MLYPQRRCRLSSDNMLLLQRHCRSLVLHFHSPIDIFCTLVSCTECNTPQPTLTLPLAATMPTRRRHVKQEVWTRTQINRFLEMLRAMPWDDRHKFWDVLCRNRRLYKLRTATLPYDMSPMDYVCMFVHTHTHYTRITTNHTHRHTHTPIDVYTHAYN